MLVENKAMYCMYGIILFLSKIVIIRFEFSPDIFPRAIEREKEGRERNLALSCFFSGSFFICQWTKADLGGNLTSIISHCPGGCTTSSQEKLCAT